MQKYISKGEYKVDLDLDTINFVVCVTKNLHILISFNEKAVFKIWILFFYIIFFH